jgi:DNA-binding NarL/FixJ family response regulator
MTAPVQNYVSRILDKTQVTDRTQAALRARDARR